MQLSAFWTEPDERFASSIHVVEITRAIGKGLWI